MPVDLLTMKKSGKRTGNGLNKPANYVAVSVLNGGRDHCGM